MDKKTQEQIQEQKSLDKFNSITQKVTPENQNQTHNSRKEGIQPINQKRQSCRFECTDLQKLDQKFNDWRSVFLNRGEYTVQADWY